jgi:hypothetical protein
VYMSAMLMLVGIGIAPAPLGLPPEGMAIAPDLP